MSEEIKARITLDTGLWIITLDHKDLHYRKTAWIRTKAEEIATELEKLARDTLEARA